METNKTLSRYRVRGELQCELGRAHDAVLLMSALKEADEENPWIAYYKSDGQRAPSMIEVRLGEIYFDRGTRVRAISFEPNFELKDSQTNAYEAYLKRLAQSVAKKNVPGVESVTANVVLSRRVCAVDVKSPHDQ